MHGCKAFDGAGITLRHRPALRIDDQPVAEVLEEDQALAGIAGENLRRGEACTLQRMGDRQERTHVFRQMGDARIGLAVAHRRTVRHVRRVHQDRFAAVEHGAFIGPRGRIPGQVRPPASRPTRLIEKRTDRTAPLQPGGKGR